MKSDEDTELLRFTDTSKLTSLAQIEEQEETAKATQFTSDELWDQQLEREAVEKEESNVDNTLLLYVDHNHDDTCLCASEKLFCQNLHLPNLRMIPRDVEFL